MFIKNIPCLGRKIDYDHAWKFDFPYPTQKRSLKFHKHFQEKRLSTIKIKIPSKAKATRESFEWLALVNVNEEKFLAKCVRRGKYRPYFPMIGVYPVNYSKFPFPFHLTICDPTDKKKFYLKQSPYSPDQCFFMEYYIYKTLGNLCKYSPRVSLAKIEIGRHNGYCFLLEDLNEIGCRFEGTVDKLENGSMKFSDYIKLIIYEIIAGNADFKLHINESNETILHNIHLIKDSQRVIPIPYDFQFNFITCPYYGKNFISNEENYIKTQLKLIKKIFDRPESENLSLELNKFISNHINMDFNYLKPDLVEKYKSYLIRIGNLCN